MVVVIFDLIEHDGAQGHRLEVIALIKACHEQLDSPAAATVTCLPHGLPY